MADFSEISADVLDEWFLESLPNFDIDFNIGEETLLQADNSKIEGNSDKLQSQKLDQKQVEAFINENKNSNTVRKTKTDLNVWKRWCNSIEEQSTMEDIPPEELNQLLSHFFMKIRKLDNTEFEPSTLTRLAGKDRRPNKALGLSNDEIEKLWSQRQLGDHSPEALVRTVWLNNTMHFGWRARDEHRKVFLGDLEVRVEEGEKLEYVIWQTERGSKTRDGGKESSSERYFNPKMYAIGGDRCPVKMLKMYISRRPKEMMNDDDPFYLTPLRNPSGHQWFKRMPLGVHSLGNFMKNMAQAVKLPGKHTNHSARRTMITTLRHENVSPLDISQLSGHKNLKSIDSYSEASEEQQKKMSLLISKQTGGREVVKPILNCVDTNSSAVGSRMTASPGKQASTSFSGAVFNHCTIVLGQSKSPLPSKRCRYVIESDDDEE
ncbi:hypothetical protein QZH41_000076 [Actinostola sp. cb2023]|nr:hypothetical protein QZH41_000076 [Actinostola sp. cb2023]